MSDHEARAGCALAVLLVAAAVVFLWAVHVIVTVVKGCCA